MKYILVFLRFCLPQILKLLFSFIRSLTHPVLENTFFFPYIFLHLSCKAFQEYFHLFNSGIES